LEALGRVDTICFDKTGTLTEGRLVVARLASVDGDLDDADPTARHLLVTAARACPAPDSDALEKVPHATDRAVLEAATREDDTLEGWQPLQEVPFETNRGYAATLGRSDGATVLAVKGAPEVVLTLCNGSSDGAQAREAADRLAADGLRVIAVAERQDVATESADDVEGLVENLSLLGFVGIADRPRDDAVDAVRRLTDDGLRVVMVTGDHPLTARAIARVVGIDDGDVVTGSELERMTEGQRVRRVSETSVFARVSPEQKVRIVEALRGAGCVVAMTGDGTNDAAAIRLADVGIGVAASGSTSARSAADLVVTDSDITRIHDALLEGRALWHRVRDAVSILVGGNAGEVAFMVLGTALAGRAPMNVRQMLLVNMLTDMFPALAVAVAHSPDDGKGNDGKGNDGKGSDASQSGDGTSGTERFDGSGAPVTAALREGLARTVAVRGTATALGATTAWAVGRWTGFSRRASSMGLAALVGTQLGQTLLMGRHSRLVVLTSLASAAVLFAAVETPGVSQFFGCTPIGPVAWGVVLTCSAGGTLAAAVAPRLLGGTSSATT
jgi:cation-transporting ATPase I